MQSAFQSILRTVLVLFAAFLGTIPLGALPEKGTPAPPLDSLTLLQAPSGAKADWGTLKGKVVVLEFWATWCPPCIASLPHINQLITTLDPAKFQFISIDDEDQSAVEKFLAKKKPLGWFGVDTSGSVYAWYGIKSRPTTVIIDGNGKIVAVTNIDSVTAADLQAVAEGKTVAFPTESESPVASPPLSTNAEPPLFSFSLSQAPPDAKSSTTEHPPTGTDFFGEPAEVLMTDLFDVFANRYVVKGDLPGGRFNLRVSVAKESLAASRPVVQQAFLTALHLQIQPKTVTKPAYMLRATEAGQKLLSPSASTHAAKIGYWQGIHILMNGTMDDLAYILATGLETPVINETGIAGAFDARFKVNGRDFDSVNQVLKTNMGLELVPGDREQSITVLEVSSLDGH